MAVCGVVLGQREGGRNSVRVLHALYVLYGLHVFRVLHTLRVLHVLSWLQNPRLTKLVSTAALPLSKAWRTVPCPP